MTNEIVLYKKLIIKCKTNAIITLVLLALFLVAYLEAFLLYKPFQKNPLDWLGLGAALTFVFIHFLSHYVHKAASLSQDLKNLFNKHEIDSLLKDKELKLDTVSTDLLSELKAQKAVSEFYYDKFKEIIPGVNVQKWKADTSNNSIIGHYKDGSSYVINCPPQLRDLLVDLQNNLDKVLK